MSLSLADLRRFAVARSLFPPTTLKRAIDRLGFVQADPIRAPARAQDLTLRHRVKGYRAGDLERRYATLGVEEDTFINYGFVTRSVFALDASARGHLALVPGRAEEGAGAAGVRARARHRAPARGGCAFLPRQGDELLGRLVDRDDASAGGHALPQPAARRAARTRRPHLRGTRASLPAARRMRPTRPRRASTRSSTCSCASTHRSRGRACRRS